jgi:hypothetical protein
MSLLNVKEDITERVIKEAHVFYNEINANRTIAGEMTPNPYCFPFQGDIAF